MAEEPPKLFTNKPKKAQVKQFQEQRANELSKPISSSSASQSQPPPPPPPKESFARRHKFLWPVLLTVNLAVGGYLFMRTKKKETVGDEEDNAVSPVLMASTAPDHTKEISPPSLAIVEPVKLREPIPENQQRELFKWMLDEKRKHKPQGPEEKKRIDEEKALLKQLIRVKSIPSI